MSADGLQWQLHDQLPADADLIDTGLGDANLAAAPLNEIGRLCALVYCDGALIGGAVGRTWGECCELQQLWVQADQRRRGIGAELVRRFERRAAERGCRTFYLETFSFQAPSLYRSLGYRTGCTIAGFPDGIQKYLMIKTQAA